MHASSKVLPVGHAQLEDHGAEKLQQETSNSKLEARVHPLSSWDDKEHNYNDRKGEGTTEKSASLLISPSASVYSIESKESPSPSPSGSPQRNRAISAPNIDPRSYASKEKNCKGRLWDFVDAPSSSPGAQVFSIFIMALILFSVVTFCLETLPQFHQKNVEVWFALESFCIAIFTLEFILRIASTPDKCKFMYDAYTIIDILAIFPYYVDVIMDLSDGQMFNTTEGFTASFLRVFRLLRVMRVFKMARYLSWMKLFVISFKQSAPPLGMFTFFVGILITVFGCVIYFLEKGNWTLSNGKYIYTVETGQPSQFESIPKAMYWCVITMTTVGYGDMYPLTVPGRLVAAAASLTGIFVLAIPITIISSNFNREYEREKKERLEAHAKMQMIRNHFRRKEVGFSSLANEIENMVTHKTARYKKKVADMIDESRSQLMDEIEELIKLAYETRVQYDKKYNERKNGVTGPKLRRQNTA